MKIEQDKNHMIFLQVAHVEITDLRESQLSDSKESLWSAERWELMSGDSIQKVAAWIHAFVFTVILLMYKVLLTVTMMLNFAIFT